MLRAWVFGQDAGVRECSLAWQIHRTHTHTHTRGHARRPMELLRNDWCLTHARTYAFCMYAISKYIQRTVRIEINSKFEPFVVHFARLDFLPGESVLRRSDNFMDHIGNSTGNGWMVANEKLKRRWNVFDLPLLSRTHAIHTEPERWQCYRAGVVCTPPNTRNTPNMYICMWTHEMKFIGM